MEIMLYQDKIKAAMVLWPSQMPLLKDAFAKRFYLANKIEGTCNDQVKVNALNELLELDKKIIDIFKLSNDLHKNDTTGEQDLQMLIIALDNKGCDRLDRQVNVMLSRRQNLAFQAGKHLDAGEIEAYQASIVNIKALNSEITKLLGL